MLGERIPVTRIAEEAPVRGVVRAIAPADRSELARIRIAGAEDVRRAVERARYVQRDWAAFSPADRARRLKGLRACLGEAADDVAATVMAETGKPEVEALAEVLVVIDLMRFYERETPRIMARRRVDPGWLLGKTTFTIREPVGVVGVISAWNYPLVLAMEPVVTALFAGNAVVLKPSEYASLTGLMVERLAADARLPEGLVQVVTGDGSTGEALVRSGVDKLFFVGSPATGRRVMAAAAETLTDVTLELGGKDPAIVLEDADLERAVHGVLFGAFFNAGQTCLATERVFVVDGIYESFVRLAVQFVRRLRVGSTGAVDIGPMTTTAQLKVVEDQLADAEARGARVLTGGGRTDPASNLIQPTVLIDVTSDMKVMRDETFGPVLPIVRVRDEHEAVARANECRYGLFASVWTGDVERGLRVANRLRAGGVSINDTLSHWAVPGLPAGGVSESGFGRSRGIEGLEEMTRTRSVLIHNFGFRREPWWYPYTGRTRALMRTLVDLRCKGWGRGAVAAVRRLMRRKRR